MEAENQKRKEFLDKGVTYAPKRHNKEEEDTTRSFLQ